MIIGKSRRTYRTLSAAASNGSASPARGKSSVHANFLRQWQLRCQAGLLKGHLVIGCARELSGFARVYNMPGRYLKLILPLCRLAVVRVSVCLFIVPIWSRINFTPLYSSLNAEGKSESERARRVVCAVHGRERKRKRWGAGGFRKLSGFHFLFLCGFEPPPPPCAHCTARAQQRQRGFHFESSITACDQSQLNSRGKKGSADGERERARRSETGGEGGGDTREIERTRARVPENSSRAA